jgi:predicted secreted protein
MARIGLDGKLYYNTATPLSPIWVEITAVRDLTLNLEKGEADASTRGSQGWRQTLGTLKDASVDITAVDNQNDAGLIALRNSFLTNAPIELAVLSGDILTPGTNGVRAIFECFGFSRGEPLEDVQTLEISVKPTPDAVPVWVTI